MRLILNAPLVVSLMPARPVAALATKNWQRSFEISGLSSIRKRARCPTYPELIGFGAIRPDLQNITTSRELSRLNLASRP